MEEIKFNNFSSFYKKNKEKLLNEIDMALESGEYIRGNITKKLEESLANICQRKYAVLTSSCTDALFFALKASGIKENDEVILPAMSYIASLSPILRCGATPVFVDICRDDLMINPISIEKAITDKTKAIVFVQLFGACADIETLQKIADKHKIILIEDAAQAIGSSFSGKPGGSFGDISCISFDPTKTISAYGTGGVLLTDSDYYYHQSLKLIHHGKNNIGDFEILGYNSKISEINACLINFQLGFLNDLVNKNQELATHYIKLLANNPEISVVKPYKINESSFHKFVIISDHRDELQKYLHSHSIQTRKHYDPLLYEHKLLKDYKFIKHNTLVAAELKHKVLSLPIYPELSFTQIEYICNCINNFYKI